MTISKYHRKDHLRDHIRDFHKEDIGSGQGWWRYCKYPTKENLTMRKKSITNQHYCRGIESSRLANEAQSRSRPPEEESVAFSQLLLNQTGLDIVESEARSSHKAETKVTVKALLDTVPPEDLCEEASNVDFEFDFEFDSGQSFLPSTIQQDLGLFDFCLEGVPGLPIEQCTGLLPIPQPCRMYSLNENHHIVSRRDEFNFEGPPKISNWCQNKKADWVETSLSFWHTITSLSDSLNRIHNEFEYSNQVPLRSVRTSKKEEFLLTYSCLVVCTLI